MHRVLHAHGTVAWEGHGWRNGAAGTSPHQIPEERVQKGWQRHILAFCTFRYVTPLPGGRVIAFSPLTSHLQKHTLLLRPPGRQASSFRVVLRCRSLIIRTRNNFRYLDCHFAEFGGRCGKCGSVTLTHPKGTCARPRRVKISATAPSHTY